MTARRDLDDPVSQLIFETETELAIEALGRAPLRGLTTEQLRAIVWVGLVDDGWGRVRDELERRGEQL